MWFILILVIIYLWFQLQKEKSPKIRYAGVQDEPWLTLPWNQSTRYGRNTNRREIEIDPHPWDIKNDPDYYRWLAYHKYGRHLEN